METLLFYKQKVLEKCDKQLINDINKEFYYFHIYDYISNNYILDLSKTINEKDFLKIWDEIRITGYTWVNFHAAGIYNQYLFIELDYREYNKNMAPPDKTFVNYSGFSIGSNNTANYKLEEVYKLSNEDLWMSSVKRMHNGN
ncbi:MAG: hypothetical protein AMQ22_01478 [Candidatus Methanofastidiosum methylothiophilum]|uniref:Uncharacterized protein n=1 Tax=Candidatus Methanofastidiosum methylothiophilum TaxID=1705564 RepID=A0A150IZM5_9EURY|nr:MAG: hypothetical protein AMQ22_01478 [Candidatus Methanofastidiosum methylthiophilus]